MKFDWGYPPSPLSQIAPGSLESVRPLGVALLITVLDKFGSALDPDVEGQKLLEQYQAQYESSIRTSMEAVNNPLLIMAGARLADKVVPAAHHGWCQAGRQGIRLEECFNSLVLARQRCTCSS